jgi:predicted nucleic acid-binding protein
MQLNDSAIAALGASLRQINPHLMKSGDGSSTKQRIWYQGNEPYFDVTVEKTTADLTWFQVTLRGKVLSWRLPDHLQTGETDELDVPPEVSYYAASKTIRDGEQINWSFVKFVQAILAQRSDDPVLAEVSQILQMHLDRDSLPS